MLEDARAVLAKYLARPAADTVLVLVTASGAKPDAALVEAATSALGPAESSRRRAPSTGASSMSAVSKPPSPASSARCRFASSA